MKIEDLDRAVALRNYRKNALDVKERAFGRPIEVKISGEDIFGHIPAEPIRQAISDTCDEEIAKFEAELRALGVSMEGGE